MSTSIPVPVFAHVIDRGTAQVLGLFDPPLAVADEKQEFDLVANNQN